MDKQKLMQLFNCDNIFNNSAKKNYTLFTMFLSAGKFSNQQITEIVNYGDKFIKELKY